LLWFSSTGWSKSATGTLMRRTVLVVCRCDKRRPEVHAAADRLPDGRRFVGFGGDGGQTTYTPILNVSFFPSCLCMR
jgi:hypothetical protein